MQMYNIFAARARGSSHALSLTRLLITMKLCIALMLIAVFQVKATAYGQNATIQARNVSLVWIFEELKKQTDYDFLYAFDDLSGSKPLTVNFKNAPITKILDAVFANQPLSYRIKKSMVLVTRKHLQAPIATVTQDSTRQIMGTVTDETGNPLSGASVSIQGGAGNGTYTDQSGRFSLTVPANSSLVVSYVGFETKTVPTDQRTTYGIALVEEPSVLEEVVVVGYSTQTKKEITGSVAIVDVEDMKNVPAGSAEQMLQGRASGLNITTSGSPGSASNIRIRGITSFGNNSPLVIIDGVQGELTDINSNDIESIQVLKDAGAAAIYGVRGSNGVIVVTTKKGKAGAAKITYDGYYGIQTPPSGNVYNLLNTQEMAEVTWKAFINSGQVDANGNPSHVQYGNGPTPVIPDYILVGTNTGVVGSLTEEQLASYNVDYSRGDIYQIIPANKEGTDWFHEIFKPAPIQSHTVSASSAGNKSSYFFSAGYFNQQGTMIDSYLKRYSVRANTSFNIKDNIRVGENLYLFTRDNPSAYTGVQNTSDTGNPLMLSFMMQPIIPVFDLMGNYAGTRARGLGQSPSPYAVAQRNGGYHNSSWTAQGNIFAEIDFLKHFNFRTSFGGFVRSGNTNNFLRRTYEDAENNSINTYNEGSSYTQQWTFTNTLQYNQKFGRHQVKVLAGLEAVENTGRTLGGSSAGYFSDDPSFLTLSSGSGNFTNRSSMSEYTLYSQFGKVDYNFDEKYIVGVTLRRDGSSRFSEQNRWGMFPAFSAGWRASEERFMEGVSWLDNLMIRGSWGILGNQLNVDPSNAYTQYNSTVGGSLNSYYDIGGTGSSPLQGFRLSRIGNLATGWEEDRLSNIGLDMTVLNSKLDLSVEYYQKRINGLLFEDQSPATAGGASLPTVNIGNIENKGVDFNANYHGTAGELTFDLGLNVTRYRSRVVDLPNTYFDTGTTRTGNFVRNQVGHPVGAFFGYQVERLFRDADDVANSPAQDAAAPGRFKYADITGDNQISTADRTFIGDPNPDFTYGLNMNASYKQFGLTMFFYGSQGNDAVNYQRWWTDFFPSLQGVKSKDLLYNSWRPDNLDAKTPIIENQSNFSNNAVPNSYYIEDASFLKLKNIMLSYTFGGNQLTRLGINQLRVYLQVANLFTITKYTGLDPELGGTESAFGIDYGNYPNNQRNYNLGVSFTF
ncbi:TonB-linked outer membrane protein, SusC/RagA family [Parapedobacter luteus]|uniref:TonB-linked outer membrane protein, SusC/RagA family n=2 Tax=Sphingobacteriaceae TaxID=84566 RepID=A0A1T5FJM8_9SPHI|nr:TonB-linked outer membrane protein, SusC/RagA family [Parapedobacter luteus]